MSPRVKFSVNMHATSRPPRRAALALALALVLALALPRAATPLGINLGNVLEAPTEGAWAPIAQEYYFDDYASRGFTFVRVPVRWDQHMGKAAPFAIDAAFLARVHEVAGWGLARNMSVLINSHHDDWIDVADDGAFQAALPRFLALWTQVAASFADAPTNQLFFEVFNEFHVISLANMNGLYAQVVPLMRAKNAARPIYLGGLSWMSPVWIAQNPDAVAWPPLADGSRDANLRLEVHSYDPYTFCLEDPPTAKTWGTPADVAAELALYTNMSAWSAAHFGRSVLMGEAGCQVVAPSRADRLTWYATIAAAAKSSFAAFDPPLSIWDDDGNWKIYDRSARTWDEGVMAALGL